jgi:predicted DNA binding CopG/RHH family protein
MKKLKIKERPSKMVSIRIPVDTLEQLREVATSRELGYQSLLKLYIGEGLRKDVAEIEKHTLLDETESLLRKHLDEVKVKTILEKLKQVAAAA